LKRWRALPPEDIGVAVEVESAESGVLTFWIIQSHGKKGDKRTHLQAVGVGLDGARSVGLERRGEAVLRGAAATPFLAPLQRRTLLAQHIEPMLRRELLHRGVISDESGYSADLIGWVEVMSRPPVGGGHDNTKSHGRTRS